jgi:hypothetical protein
VIAADKAAVAEVASNSTRTALSDDEFTAIFDNTPSNPTEDKYRDKTLKMESSLKNAILERLKNKK